MIAICLPQPPDFVDFFFNFQTFQIVKFWFMTLEGAVDVILPSTRYSIFTLKRKMVTYESASKLQNWGGERRGVAERDEFFFNKWNSQSMTL